MLRKWRSESVLDLYNLLLAVILFGAPAFLAHASRTADLDLGLTGAAIIVLSIAAMIAFSIWEEWVNTALGLWLVVSPWVLGFAHTRAMHFAIGIGIAITFLAALDLWLRYEAAERDAISSADAQKRLVSLWLFRPGRAAPAGLLKGKLCLPAKCVSAPLSAAADTPQARPPAGSAMPVGRPHTIPPSLTGRQASLCLGNYSAAAWTVGCGWKMPAPDTWEAIKKAATMAGTLISLRN